MKRRNPRFGCPRIAQQINRAFDTAIDKDVVRRILASHITESESGGNGPSCLIFLSHTKDSLWSHTVPALLTRISYAHSIGALIFAN